MDTADRIVCVIRVMKPPQSRGCTALLLLPPTHTLRWNAHFHTHRLFCYDLILYISWYVWYCGVNVVFCYDAVCVWRGEGYFWTFGWDGGGSVSVRLSPSLSLSFTSFCFWGETFSLLPFSRPARDWKIGKRRIVGTDHKHIPDYFLSVLSFYPDSFLLRQYNMCLVLADSHVYKVHICVHMCNTRYSSNLLLWLLLMMMILVPFSKFQPVFFLVVLISCWWIVLQEIKKGRWLLWFFTLSLISGVCGHFNEALFYYSQCNVVTLLILIICFFVFF